jgi:hypothetical protein
MKSLVAVLALVVAGSMCAAADDLDDSYAALKELEGKKDPDQVKKVALETSKLARELANSKQPADAAEVQHWKDRVQFAKEVDVYSEYALSRAATETEDPAKVADLVETLIAQNPKSQYLGQCAAAYLTAVGKQGAAKQQAGAQKLLAAQPNNEEALYIAMNGTRSNPRASHDYATRLINTLKAKPKPEGVAAAEWESHKAMLLGSAQYTAGVAEGSALQDWASCDRNLRASLPFVARDPQSNAAANFYLGVCNYQLGKMINDKAKMREAVTFSDKAASISGPLQQQAYTNSTLIKRELGITGTAPATKK